ncbi:MAG: DUF2029 domain-containing protein [Proteobacteria bacterium]|nr:DUF2029 domain-containing protein [Pseudomonadota bacterium]
MTALASAPPPASRFSPWTLMWIAALGALAGYAYCVWVFLDSGQWWINATGLPADLDFVCFWSAGRLVIDGAPLGAYTPDSLARWSEDARSYPFFYPPAYLLLVAPLGLLPFTAAAAAWVGATGAAYLAAVRAILPRAPVVALAAAAPAAFFNVYVGQNGLLTAALFGGALVLLDRRPIAAGLLIAALAYKPHFGLLIPFLLLLTGRWRVFASATAGLLALNLLAAAAFGPQVFGAFLDGMTAAQNQLLETGALPWWKVQSLYGATRWLDIPAPLAWTLHAAFALPLAGGLLLLWRSRAPYALQAAALPTAALLVSPYSAVYDYAVLMIPAAFLIRDGLRSALLPLEIAALAAALLLPLFFIIHSTPLGVPAGLALAAVIAHRWRVWSREASAQAPGALSPAAWQTTPAPVPT